MDGLPGATGPAVGAGLWGGSGGPRDPKGLMLGCLQGPRGERGLPGGAGEKGDQVRSPGGHWLDPSLQPLPYNPIPAPLSCWPCSHWEEDPWPLGRTQLSSVSPQGFQGQPGFPGPPVSTSCGAGVGIFSLGTSYGTMQGEHPCSKPIAVNLGMKGCAMGASRSPLGNVSLLLRAPPASQGRLAPLGRQDLQQRR